MGSDISIGGSCSSQIKLNSKLLQMTARTIKLKSSDNQIFIVDEDIVRKMVTIQTMLDSLGDDDDSNNNDEPIPIYSVNGEVLDKVIEWTKYHVENQDKSISENNKVWSDNFGAWIDQKSFFFMTNLKNIFLLMEAGDYLEIESLLIDSQLFIDENFVIITTTEAFKNFSHDKLAMLLARDSLEVTSEQTVFESLLSWISEDPVEKLNDLEELLPHIRANFLTGQFIDDKVKTFLKHKNLDYKLNYKNKTPRIGYEECIVIVLNNNCYNYSLAYLDLKTGIWTNLTEIPKEYARDGCKVCCVKGNIYLVGGYRGGYRHVRDSRVTEYNPHTNTWRNMPNEGLEMYYPNINVCTVDNKIFTYTGL